MKKRYQEKFWEWMRRPARRLEYLRLEGFTESEVDGIVLRAALQKTAFTLIASGVLGLAAYAMAGVQHGAGVFLWVLYAAGTALYVGVNLFAMAVHLLVVTQQYLELRRRGESLREFGDYSLKVAANAVSLAEQVGLAAFVVVLYQHLWPD